MRGCWWLLLAERRREARFIGSGACWSLTCSLSCTHLSMSARLEGVEDAERLTIEPGSADDARHRVGDDRDWLGSRLLYGGASSFWVEGRDRK